jgi:hypothetical protein
MTSSLHSLCAHVNTSEERHCSVVDEDILSMLAPVAGLTTDLNCSQSWNSPDWCLVEQNA